MTFLRHHYWLVAVVGSSVLAFALRQTAGTPQPPGKSSQPGKSVFVDTIIESGSVRGANDLLIRSPFPEPMTILSVADDMSAVSLGDVILRVDASAQRSSLAEARSRLADATNTVEASKSEVDALTRQMEAVQKLNEVTTTLAQTLLKAAKSEADAMIARKTLLAEQMERQKRIQTLYQEASKGARFDGLSMPEQLEIQREVLTAETVLADLRHKVSEISESAIEKPVFEATVRSEELKLNRLQQIDSMRSQLMAAKRSVETGTLAQQDAAESLRIAQEALEACNVLAPRAGVLAHVPLRNSRAAEPFVLQPGERIPVGAELFRMHDTEHFEVEGSLNEAKTARVRVGQPVIVEPDALPGLQLLGRVKSIAAAPSPGAWPNTDLREFPFVVQFEGESEEKAKQFLKNGLTCLIRIDLRDK